MQQHRTTTLIQHPIITFMKWGVHRVPERWPMGLLIAQRCKLAIRQQCTCICSCHLLQQPHMLLPLTLSLSLPRPATLYHHCCKRVLRDAARFLS